MRGGSAGAVTAGASACNSARALADGGGAAGAGGPSQSLTQQPQRHAAHPHGQLAFDGLGAPATEIAWVKLNTAIRRMAGRARRSEETARVPPSGGPVRHPPRPNRGNAEL
jgi:hypothetical protein